MIKKCFLILSFLTTLLFSCKKQEVPDTKFTFKAQLQSSNSVLLSWSAVNLAEFKNITIYRSTSPIPDPTFQTSIDGSLMVSVITDKTVTNFVDSNFNVGSNGAVYYKLVVNLSNRFIVSEQEQITFNAFTVTLSNPFNQFSSSFASAYLSEKNFLYVLNYSAGTINLIDYTQKKITATVNFSSNVVNTTILATIDNGNPELFVVLNNTEIACYDGVTLAQKYIVNVSNSNSISDFKVKNGFLYVINNNGYLYTYNLSTQALVGQLYVINSSGINNYGVFVGNLSNQVYVKYSNQISIYQPSTSSYVYSYKNILQSYNLVNGAPIAPSNNVNITALNTDTTNYANTNNSSYSHMSVDGKYLACNQNGDIYSFVDNSTHNIRSVNNFSPYSVFSDEEKYILGKTFTNSSSNSFLMDVYSLPNFNLITSLRSLNTGQFVLGNDFIDNDSLISYNVSQNSTGSQVAFTLTVLFKKLD